MGKIIVSEFLSLDGVMEAPETWHFPFISDDMSADIQASIHECEAMLYGRATYEEHAGFWPTQTHNEFGIADKLNSAPKFVVSTTLDHADWNNTTVIRSDVTAAVRRLRQEVSGIIGLSGSGVLARSLMQAGLIDGYRLWIHPVVVGRGRRLFADVADMTTLRLVETRTFQSGVISLTYHTAHSA